MLAFHEFCEVSRHGADDGICCAPVDSTWAAVGGRETCVLDRRDGSLATAARAHDEKGEASVPECCLAWGKTVRCFRASF